MTSVATLLGEIFSLTRGDLETASFPWPRLMPALRPMSMVRLTRLAAFWKQGEADDPTLLLKATADLVTGLYAQQCPWVFLLRGSPTEVECWLGVHQEVLAPDALQSLLLSAFPDARFGPATNFEIQSYERFHHAQVLTGTPSVKLMPRITRQYAGEQVEKICRGLAGEYWIYLVSCEPIASVETIRSINELSERIRDARTNYLLRASPVDEQNRTAERYVELLEAKLKRWERGHVSGMWNTQTALLTENSPAFARGQHLLQAAFSGESSQPVPIRVRPCAHHALQTPVVEPLNSEEVAILARPPWEDYPGYEITEYARFGVEPPHQPGTDVINVGEIQDRGAATGNWLNVRRTDLTQHALVAGMTGSGKTNTCFWLLDQIWDAGNGVPFLVIEPAKSEYRQLLRSPRFRGLNVFTIGDETVSPVRLNPFEVPLGILVQTHIDYVKALFSAAFVLYPPMPYVLEQSIQEVYEDRGWDIARNSNARGTDSDRLFPTLSDLAAKVGVVVDRMGYDQRITMDVEAGLLARIDQLRMGGGKGLMLNTRSSVRSAELFESPCLLELKQIVSDDEKAFIMGLLLIRLHEYHEARPKRGEGLVHVTLIEEAHRLLRNVSTEQGSEVSANPKGRAIEVFANILSEIRAYGEGILIAEQVPVKLTPDAIKNTSLKLIHRLVSTDDRELVGGATNLDEAQMRYLAALEKGMAVAWAENARKALLIRIPLSPVKADGDEISSGELRAMAEPARTGRAPTDLPFGECAYCQAVPRGSICLSRRAEAHDSAVRDAFRRLLNTMRFNPALIVGAYEEFAHLVHRSAGHRKAGEPYCSFVELTETEMERRGEFRGWPYQDVEAAISMACRIVRTAMNAAGNEKNTLQDAVVSEAAEFRALCSRLDAIDTLPYPGCRHCGAPCMYRFDMARVDATYGNEFRMTFLDPNAKNDRALGICRTAAARYFSAQGTASLQGAALCFAIQQLGRNDLGLSMNNQYEMAAMIRDRLAAID